MSAAQSLLVIVERGEVVGTQVLSAMAPGVGAPAVTATLRAGAEQSRHVVQAVVPASFRDDAARRRFHAGLLAKVKAAS